MQAKIICVLCVAFISLSYKWLCVQKKKKEKIASKLFKMPPFCQSVPFSGEKCMKRGAEGGMEEYHTGPIKMTIFIVDYHLPDQRYTPNGNDRRTSFPYQCRMS